jgi:predicted HTH domain antitoxin
LLTQRYANDIETGAFEQIEFQELIASRGICVHYDIEDLEQDLKSLREDV